MNWVFENKEWLFSGLGMAVLGCIFSFFFKNRTITASEKNKAVNTNTIAINVGEKNHNPGEKTVNDKSHKKSLGEYKNETRILFIDDDARFKVAKILTQSGWVHTKLIKDCKTLDEYDIVEANLLFIDVQGVGVAMGFNDEGLGLALAVKEKYPEKKVIIYSAETKGDRFHEALRKADSFLPKNADPYEFQRIVEEFTIGLES
ncbi:hypothetical protein B0H98_101423 [Vreelandella songnenensis]|uniref:Response regulator receiver domain-containing protein n=1 Tax=Vreelandella songnenensis TaxID=1176243 RepID=A0A2T0V8B6_9GAMM|nr:response regulator transcription factor [Halomonas songnenensis]PRY66439.1 hypothetical protein B0H98_101423 [Halomonas songnenensis]